LLKDIAQRQHCSFCRVVSQAIRNHEQYVNFEGNVFENDAVCFMKYVDIRPAGAHVQIGIRHGCKDRQIKVAGQEWPILLQFRKTDSYRREQHYSFYYGPELMLPNKEEAKWSWPTTSDMINPDEEELEFSSPEWPDSVNIHAYQSSQLRFVGCLFG
jgi:hypothetical protein